MSDSTHSIFRSAKRFFSGTLLSRLSGMARDMIMAFAFGTQDALAAFFVAFRFSHLLRRLLGEGALQMAFIPHFEKLRHESPQQACNFFRNLSIFLLLLLSLVVLLSMAGLWAALTWGSLNPNNQEIVYLTFLMMPSLLFICLFGLNASLLQCEKKYFTSSAAPAAFNIVWIIGILFLWHQTPVKAMPWLAGFIVLACFVQWLITLFPALAILQHYLGKQRKALNLFSSELRLLGPPLFLGVIGVAASQINNALDSIFARWAENEGPAYLWYSIRLQQLPLALFGIALSGALLPPLSRAIKAQNEDSFYHFLNFALTRTGFFMIPMMVGFLAIGDSCVTFLYGHGDFTSVSIKGTTYCLWGYTLGLLPMAYVLVLAPAFYAKGNYSTPAKASFYSMLLNVGLNSLLVFGFGWGATSVALATSVSAWFNFVYLVKALYRQTNPLAFSTLYRKNGKFFLACGLASIALFSVEFLLTHQIVVWKLLTEKTVDFPSNWLPQLYNLLIKGIGFGIPLLFFAWLLKIDEIALVIRAFRYSREG